LSVTPLYKPRSDRPMYVAGFMSGSGTNLIRILEYQRKMVDRLDQAFYEVTVIFTDRPESAAEKIGSDFGVPVLTNDIMAFYRARGHSDKKDLSLRPEFDERTVCMLTGYEVDFVALAGYMSVVTEPLFTRFDGRMVNVHPADLRVRAGDKRRYTGDHAVEAAIKNGEGSLRSTVHLVRREVDYGEILAVSAPVPVRWPDGVAVEGLSDPANKQVLRRVADEHQERLKRIGDWVIYPRTLELLSQGRFAFDGKGALHFDGKPVPDGIVIEEESSADAGGLPL